MTKNEFVDEFLRVFADRVSEKDKRLNGIGVGKKDFLWNVFAGKFVERYEGDEARKIYDTVDKIDATEIYYSGHNRFFEDDNRTSFLNEKHKTAKGIDDDGVCEFYVIGKDFSWCYVVTHEFDLCGPYFCFNLNN